MLDLSEFELVPRNAYALVQYTPEFGHSKGGCDKDAEDMTWDFLLGGLTYKNLLDTLLYKTFE